MTKILILTTAYPYYPGEQFIEEEIKWWSGLSESDVVIAPMLAHGNPREMPKNINVDLTLARHKSAFEVVIYAFFALFWSVFWNEIKFLFKKRSLNLYCMAKALSTCANVLVLRKDMLGIFKKYNDITFVYSYWNDIQSYAAVSLKEKCGLPLMVSRAHGYDVYESRRPFAYMPLKRQFINHYDAILAVSEKGRAYLNNTYGTLPGLVEVSRLGVAIPDHLASVSVRNELNILSVSHCVPVKRIDKLIAALPIVAKNLPSLLVRWTHIGDGPHFHELKLQAEELLVKYGIEHRFLGSLSNQQVRDYFACSPVDLFVNTSESEGVPVSIMEAMSFGVPAVAPDVGGVSEILSAETGILMSSEPGIQEIAESITKLAFVAKDCNVRNAARAKIVAEYSASNNYGALLAMINARNSQNE